MKRAALFFLFAATLTRAADPAPKPATTPAPEITVTPTAQYSTVKGDEHQFKTDTWQNDGWTGGGDATVHQDLGKETTLDLSGHGIANDGDYGAALDFLKKNVFFFKAGWAEYRQYSDYTGGYYQPFPTPSFTLAGDKYLTIGKISVEGGLILPNLPKITLGYERQYQNGDKSLLEWGSVTEGATSRKIYPSTKNIDEHTDIIKVGIEHEIKNVHLANQFRYEHYSTDTKTLDTAVNLNTAATKTVTVNESYSHDAFFNTFHMDSHFNEKVYWSVGYLFTTLSGDGDMSVNTSGPVTSFDRNWSARVLDIGQESHVLNMNVMFGPFKSLTFYTGVQAEQTTGNGASDALLATGLAPATTNIIRSSTDKTSLEETVGARYTKIPFTTLYAEARLTEQQIDLSEHQTVDNNGDFVNKNDADIFRQDYRGGFNTAPFRYVTFSGRYRHAIYENDYSGNIDTEPGYPGYITSQDFTTDDVTAKMTVRPCTYFTASLQYQLVSTDIKTGTAGVPSIAPKGTRISGTYDANIYSVSATVSPISRLYLTGMFSFLDTHTTAFDNGSAAVTAYKGNVYSFLSTAGYAIDNKTDATLEYSYSWSDNFKNNAAAGLPLGLDNSRTSVIAGLSRKFTDNLIARVRYGWYQYNETSNGGINDYTAQLVSVSSTYRF